MDDCFALGDDEIAELEIIVEQGAYRDWIAAGQALAEIRDSRSYRRTHRSFKSYLAERFDLPRSGAYELMNASKVAVDLSARADIRLPQRHAHLLYRFPDRETRVLLARRIVGLSIREATKVVVDYANPGWHPEISTTASSREADGSHHLGARTAVREGECGAGRNRNGVTHRSGATGDGTRPRPGS